MVKFITLICAISLCLFVECSGKYVVPPAMVELLEPKGFRVSIPDEEGITLMAFHGNINIPFEGLDAGEYARDIIKKRGDRWVYEDKNIRLKKGDVVYYWLFVILDGLGYQGLDRNFTVPGQYSNDKNDCNSTISRVKGESVCSQKLLLDATFKGNVIDSNIWYHERKIGGSDLDDEFVVFANRNTFVANDKLEIKPSLLEELYSVDFLKRGELTIEGCTSNEEEYCKKKATSYLILPPVLSSRVSTKNSFSFQYGTVEIKAKLPEGDWIVPELWLQPKDMGNTGRIVIALARGNILLTVDGNDISSKTLTAGAMFDVDQGKMFKKESSSPWTQEYHNFKLVWIQNRLTFFVDDIEIGMIESPDPLSDFVPFNKEYFITLGVHVGGYKVFPDSPQKPWKNSNPKRVYTFWSDRRNWVSSWNKNSALFVEHVKVWAI